ncbi:hypothetical protein [Mucilaginibacter sp. L3T2-6]|uniref:hypothetical protein n=1 Tax=Mucilaginibacter sp. L3T2-6 TaxID=3062491 RepID=UPI002676B055|nr:hypothetical protein [Mucilaginibacter sp. L3T2-6]MDO3640958.1 hypothetical protein [Mucilaginibacter sp. L3T2-6]MDV6213566.1 hypothetical protein [Mucilaginibacter sp. L3T2-6]
MSIATTPRRKPVFLKIFLTGLVAGTLDAIAAIIWSHKVPPAVIFQYIASGVFGKAAFQSGSDMVLWGLTFHYLIATGFTTVFYFAYPLFYRIFRNKYIIACAYGIVTWFFMNLVVVPLSKIGPAPFKHLAPILIGMGILIICIGLPVALVADRNRTK